MASPDRFGGNTPEPEVVAPPELLVLNQPTLGVPARPMADPPLIPAPLNQPATPSPASAPVAQHAQAASAPAQVTVPVPPLLDDKGAPLLPQLAGAPRPPLPDGPLADESLYLDKPGGEVLVLVLFLNDQGVVVDSSIGVPSAYPLDDMALAWASLGQRWRDLKPPLLPGEVRRLELRIPYEKNRKKPATHNPLP